MDISKNTNKVSILAFFILVATLPVAQAQQFYIDMRATVQQEDGGFVSMEHVTAPLFEDAFYVSTVRSLPPPDGSVLIESVSEASLISGRLHLRNSCAYPSLSQTCSGRAHWKDRLTYDLTGLPAGPVLVDVAATVSGTYGAALSTGFTVFAQSADQFAVIDTLRADVSFWRSFTTTTADPLGFTLLNSNGTWSTLGPEFYVGQLELAGGTVNTVNVEMLFNADTNQDLTGTFAISTAQGVPFTSSSGVFLSDLDGDGIVNSADNCTEHANPSQTDTDGDNFGNRCDPDLNNDGIVNFADLQPLKSVFFSADANADFNEDGFVNFGDLQIMKEFFFGPPGPTGIAAEAAPTGEGSRLKPLLQGRDRG